MPRRRRQPSRSPSSAVPVAALCVLVLLVEVVVLPGAASPFRVPKMAVALAGLALLTAWTVARAARAGSLEIPRGGVTSTLLVLPCLYAVTGAWSSDALRSLAAAAGTLIWAVAVAWLATATHDQRRRVTRWAAIGVCVSAGVMLLQAAGFRPLGVVGAESSGRLALTGLTGNPADLAMAAMLLLPLAAEAFAGHRSRPARWAVPAALLGVPVATQSLTGVVAIAAVTAVWLIQRRSARLWIVTAAVAVVVGGVALTTGLGDRARTVGRQIAAGDWYQLLSARDDGWTAAAEMILSHPGIGVGAGAYTVEFYPARLAWLEAREASGRRGELATHFESAHCDPLQLAAETGALGVAWTLALLVSLWRSGAHRDPVLVQMAAVSLPFLLLHYPTFLAVGLVPVALGLARVTATEPRLTLGLDGATARRLVVATVVAIAVVVSAWQARRVAVDVWKGAILAAFDSYQALAPAARGRALATLEGELVRRGATLTGHQAWVSRKLGLVQLTRGEPAAAVPTLRRSMELWPHEEAELGLGVALYRLGRRTEALAALGRVSRVNPALVTLIPDDDLRRAVEELVRARRQIERHAGG